MNYIINLIKIFYKRKGTRKRFKPIFDGEKKGLKLSKQQKIAKKLFNSKVKKNIYKKEILTCICGRIDDNLIAIVDRYGFKINTVICKNCGLIRTNPYYTQNTIEEFYNNEYRIIYDGDFYLNEENFNKKFESRKSYGKKILMEISKIQNLSEINGKIVYDIGCSLGGILASFQDVGAKCYGCDFNEKYVSYGNSRGLKLFVGDYKTLLNNGKADIIVINHVLEHIINPIEFLNGIKNILKNDGMLFIAVPLIENIKRDYKSNLFLYLQNAHVFNYSMLSLKYILECCGFTIILENLNFNCLILKINLIKRSLDDIDNRCFKQAMQLLNELIN